MKLRWSPHNCPVSGAVRMRRRLRRSPAALLPSLWTLLSPIQPLTMASRTLMAVLLGCLLLAGAQARGAH